MGRIRTALATISVGALLATAGQTVPAWGAVPAGATPNGATGGLQTGGGQSRGGNSGQTADPGQADAGPTALQRITINPPAGTGQGLPGSDSPIPACAGSDGPPRKLVPLYIAASRKYGLGGLGPQTLAAINRIETDFGRLNEVTSSAGAIGWMQFMPATWEMYGVDADGDGKADPYNPKDAIFSAANYLKAAGAPDNWYDAIWAYNHADWYVRDVQERASCYGPLEGPGTTRPADQPRLEVLSCEPSELRALEIPNYYRRAFEHAAMRYGLGRRGVWMLAAAARIESDYGRGMDAAQMKETGPMGLTGDEWKRFGVDGDGDGVVRRSEPWDAIATFARMLWSHEDLQAGLFAHSHAAWYVEAVTAEARQVAGECESTKAAWKLAYYPRTETNRPLEINWDNLTVLNPAAANDIATGLVDSRIIQLLAMLTQKYSLQLSALRSDHSMMTASGNISNHFGGRAMDIAAVNGVSCVDQSAGSPCTEVGLLLASLPDGIRPTELIYGWDLDGAGPAFALSDHRNHIHAGFGA